MIYHAFTLPCALAVRTWHCRALIQICRVNQIDINPSMTSFMTKILDVTTLRSRPLTPNSGGTEVQSPAELGDLGGVPGFVQEVL